MAHLPRIAHHALFASARGGNLDRHLELAVFLDELGEVLDGAITLVFDRRVLGAGGEELDGGEALDLIGDVVGRGIDFGDGDGGVGVEGAEFFVFGCETVDMVSTCVVSVGG